MRKAVLFGYYGMGNLGDELMLICLKKWLANQGVEAVPVAPNPESVHRLHGFNAIQNYPMLGQFSWVDALIRGKVLQTIRAISASDVVIFGGGDVIRDGIGWKVFSYQIEKMAVALLYRKPLFLLNIGISRPRTRYGRALLRYLLPKCTGIVVREQRSIELCRELGASDRVSLLPDIVYQLPDFFSSATASRQPLNDVLVALHGNPNLYGQYAMTNARFEVLADILDWMVEEHDVAVHFFPFQCLPGGGDSQIHEQLQHRMRHSDRATLLDWTIDLSEIARRFSSSRLVIAMRLHAAILSAAFRRPCVLMPYDEKVWEFGRQAAIPHILTADMLDQPSVAKAVIANALMRPTLGEITEHSTGWLSFALPQR